MELSVCYFVGGWRRLWGDTLIYIGERARVSGA